MLTHYEALALILRSIGIDINSLTQENIESLLETYAQILDIHNQEG